MKQAQNKQLTEQQNELRELKKLLMQKDQQIKENEKKINKQELIINKQEVIISKKEDEISRLTYFLEQLKRMIFGQKSERFENPDQLELFPQEVLDAKKKELIEEVEVIIKKRKSYDGKHPGREPLPKDLPVEEVVLEPTEDVTGMVRIREEITEELHIKPAYLFIRRIIRPIYITKPDENNKQRQVIAELSRPIPKIIAGSSLLSYLIVNKYVFHLPIHRQLQQLKLMGITLNASTVENWIRLTSELLEILYKVHRQKVQQSPYLQMDESPIQVMDRETKGKTKRGYMWVSNAVRELSVLFEYAPSRSQSLPNHFLDQYRGILQTDGYAAYDVAIRKHKILHIGCWAHARRYFEKALSNDKAPATAVMLLIQELYKVEEISKEQNETVEERYQRRLKESLPLLNQIGKYIADHRKDVLPSSPIGKAFNYCVERWDNLMNYLQNGMIEIDNNRVENAIRPLALGRKNYLFAGNHEFAQFTAIYYSFFATCKLNDINPYDWFAYVVENINETKTSQLEKLLPQNIDKSLLVETKLSD